jgi:hypothetical protein
MTEMTEELALVVGGAPNASNLGRCGPSDRWKFLGNVYTPACRAHDIATRSALRAGASHFGAFMQALPKLPAAIGSYVTARLG